MTEAYDTTVEKEAAFWFARLRSDELGEEDRARFSRWLAADPAHVSAYADYQGLWSDLDDVAASGPILALRREALKAGERSRRAVRRRWIPLGAIAASIAVALVGGWMWTQAPALVPPASSGGPATYSTEVGERSSITLADGSVVQLNTDSLLEVDYAEGRRGLKLLRGQALFEVAHDRNRPFVVQAGGQQITALGTAFDVHVEAGETRVTLIEGRIEVKRVNGTALFPVAPEARKLAAGEQLVALEERPFVVRPADVEKAVSWREGRVVFSDEPLVEVIEEINRYSTRKVVLGDGELGAMRVSGVFRPGSADRFVAALEIGFPVEAELDQRRDVVVLTRR
ncbi:FecR family protein [Roseibacterium beibuensis]|uniref:FecR family protein n=1 Tax=[Roseibacterium] beibuensis TaxID=1193142 RepID=UPI00217DE3D3|nr:FecR family protein [Roseibacterium beibuensis]MCS6624520.1 FecR family protein [Roseibacterium beibuensis]